MAADDSQPPPHWYIAGEPLFLHDPESGVMPVQAFAAGDRVPPDMVDAHGWHGQVRRPDPEPDPPAPPPVPPRPAPAATKTTPRSKEE